MPRQRNQVFLEAEKWLNEKLGRTIEEYRKLNPDIPPLKVKTGSLKNQNARVSFKKEGTFNAERNRLLWIKQTTPDAAQRKNANSFIKQQKGPGIEIDHKLSNSRLAKGEQFQAARQNISLEEANQRAREAYRKAKQGYGHDTQNLQKLTSQQNNYKNVQEAALDRYYKHLEEKPSTKNTTKLKLWEKKREILFRKVGLDYIPNKSEVVIKNNGNGNGHNGNGKNGNGRNGGSKIGAGSSNSFSGNINRSLFADEALKHLQLENFHKIRTPFGVMPRA